MISQYIIFIHIRIYIYIYNICIHIIYTLFIVDIDIPEITNMTFSAFGLTLTSWGARWCQALVSGREKGFPVCKHERCLWMDIPLDGVMSPNMLFDYIFVGWLNFWMYISTSSTMIWPWEAKVKGAWSFITCSNKTRYLYWPSDPGWFLCFGILPSLKLTLRT